MEKFAPNRRMKDGWSSWCRSCHNEATQRWRAKNPEHLEAYNKSRRVPPTRRIVCRICGGGFYAKHATREVCHVCRETCKNRDLEKKRATQREYERSRAGRGSAKQRVRRERVRSGDLTTADVRALLSERTFCPLCRKKMSDEKGHPRKRHLDHIVPISRGGTHTWGNVRVICATCNLSRPSDGSDVERETLWARAI